MTSGRRPPRRQTLSKVQPTTALQTPYAYPLPTRPRSPYAALNVRCTNSSIVKPSTPVTRRMRPETKRHAGTLSS